MVRLGHGAVQSDRQSPPLRRSTTLQSTSGIDKGAVLAPFSISLSLHEPLESHAVSCSETKYIQKKLSPSCDDGGCHSSDERCNGRGDDSSSVLSSSFPPVLSTDLHALLRTCDWKGIYETLLDLRDTTDEEILIASFRERNDHHETPLHVMAWKAPPKLAICILKMLPVDVLRHMLLQVDECGNTALHLACANLDVENLEFGVIKNLLLLASETLEMLNDTGDSPLHLLVTSQAFRRCNDFDIEAACEEAISSLLRMLGGYWVMAQNNAGLTLMHAAIAHGAHERVLVKLLNTAPKVASVADRHGRLPIHYIAAFAGSTPWTFAVQLLGAYADGIFEQTLDGDTPLHLLMSNSHKNLRKRERYLGRNVTKLAELLVGSGKEEGASPVLITNNERLSPLHCCALFRTPPQLTGILMASPLAKVSSALTTQFGATALHLLCASGRVADSIETLEALATYQACQVLDASKRTPLAVAVQNPKASVKVIKILCNANPEVVEVPLRGFLPLHLAVQTHRCKNSIVKALLKAAPDSVRALTSMRNTPLHEACRYNAASSVITLLVDKFPESIHAKNAWGEEPVILAQASGVSREIRALLKGSRRKETSLRQ